MSGSEYVVSGHMIIFKIIEHIFLYIININPIQIVIELIPSAQNKYFWDSKNIGLSFTSCQYFL